MEAYVGETRLFPPQVPFTEQLVESFVQKLRDEKRLKIIEYGGNEERIENTLHAFFRFLVNRVAISRLEASGPMNVGPAHLSMDWFGPARQVLSQEWSRKPPASVKMIARRTIAFFEERNFAFKRPLLSESDGTENVIRLSKRPR